MTIANPFAQRSDLDFELPPFALIKEEHYLPAFYEGCTQQLAEVQAILDTPGAATFENTIVALEKSGQMLMRTLLVFFNKSSSDTNDAMDKIEEEMAPKLAAHQDAINLNPALYARIKSLYDNRESIGLNTEDAWLLERYYKDLIHAGAHLSESQRDRLKELNEELSKLETQFSKNVLADTNDLAVLVDTIDELDGLSENEIASAAAAAKDRGHEGKWLIGMVNFSGNPVLDSLTNRALRKKIMQDSLLKGNRANENDNKPVILKVVKLRAERAKLFGKNTHAEHVIAVQTAEHPDNVHAMLRKIAPAAVRNAQAEAQDLKKSAGTEIESWDWGFYTEQVRLEKYNIDTSKMRPYFELESVLANGIFFAANKLFGITFKERPDLVTYHPEARAFEVFNEDGSKLGLFIGDFYTRDSKRGGAWMNTLVDQNFLCNQLPVVVNNLNIPKPPAGKPTLLTFSETTTLFHEFGHALHGLLSQVKYPRVSGTSVQRDFVEFPSQVNEMWILWPEVVENYARHFETGEKLPQEWIDNLDAASTFNEGHATTSYLAAAILDLAWHSLDSEEAAKVTDVEAFEAQAIKDYGLDFAPVPTRYRSTYFSHIFAGGYSAGYYGYIWSEVLDADTVDWFKENGGLQRKNGEHFRNTLLGRGGSIDSMQMFRNFRGRDSKIEPLLKRRGLL
ncbi:peptidyl-dipeptidase Dcp [Candidatus Planktophila vernalis]|uniref:Peptidyl-dipeptidase Dcp n=1 Tax=Candidatus Planktophila vernalis TaxID=1884907 RepID=A0A249KRR9_9ACTN|nr:M3 family metallopeptidase [Candidatus Planktophila vernalis]ASY19379.1 peptidyl-dipeptidase Dcp [Candidatus Planktophila vernalis]